VKRVLVTAVGDFLKFPKSHIVNYVVRRVRKQVPRWSIPAAIPLKSAVAAGLGLPLAPVDVGPDDLAFLQYTGGTTGVAKGAMLSHGNVSINVLQAQAWLGKRFENEPAVLITAIPLYHVFALSANCLLFARLGWKNVLIINPRDLPAMIADLRRHPFKFISGVNTLFNALLHAPGFGRLDFSQLKVTLGGGMAVQATVAQRWKEVTGCVLTQAWGPRSRGGRPTRRALRRGRRAVRGAQGPGAQREGHHRALPQISRRVQSAEARVLQKRAPEVKRRQDFEKGVERGVR